MFTAERVRLCLPSCQDTYLPPRGVVVVTGVGVTVTGALLVSLIIISGTTCVVRYFEAMCAIAEHLGGTIVEFIGDAMLVVWNIPHPRHDHASRCLQFAIEAQQELQELRQIWIARGLPRVEVRLGMPMVTVHLKNLVGNL